MAEQRLITEAQSKMALANPAQVWRDKTAGAINYAADYVLDALDDTVGAIDGDIVVTTTINAAMQAAAEQALADELAAKGTKFGVGQGAVVALDPSGGVKAMIGGKSYAESQFNRAVAARRQPGSSFKPFVYLTALEKGLTPDSVREDAPISIRGWSPENYSREYFGPVTLTKGLSLSLNTVAVRLGLEVGPKAVCETAHRLGIASELEPNASIALGTSAVTPLEMASAYAAFANGGVGVQPHVITKVRTASGKLLYARRNASFGRAIDPRYVPMMNTMMQETLLTGTARKAELPGWQAAGKTGTSQDFRDAWFVGYTSYLVAAVWLGNDDNSPTRKVSGGNLPVEIWSRFMKAAHQNVAPAPLPLGTWQPAPSNPFAPLLAPFTGGGGQPQPSPPGLIPPVGGRGGGAPVAAAPLDLTPAAPQPAARARSAPAPADVPVPPALIPDPGPGRKTNAFLSKIFGIL